MRFVLHHLILCTLACGCAAPPAKQSVADQIAWAHEMIDAQRAVKRRLLVSDPIERQIEVHLSGDPRVASARFALHIHGYGSHAVSDDAPFWFESVVATHEPMSEADATELLTAASESAGARPTSWHFRIVHDETTWSASGAIYPTMADNPDLSPLGRE